MTDAQFNELASRIDGVGRVLEMLIADLEIRECLNGPRFCRQIRVAADRRKHHTRLAKSAEVIEQIADQLDQARQSRSEECQNESQSRR